MNEEDNSHDHLMAHRQSVSEKDQGQSPVILTIDSTSSSLPSISKKLSYGNLVRGSIAVVSMVVIWVLQVEIIKALATTMNYQKPFFQRAIGQSFLGLCLPMAYIYKKLQKNQFQLTMEKGAKEPTFMENWRTKWRHYALRALIFTTGYHLMGYIWFVSIPLTESSTNITLNQMYIAFSFIFSVKFLGENCSWKKILFICLTILGIIIVGVSAELMGGSSDSEAANQPMGIFLVLLSAVVYSVVQLYYGLKVQPCIENPTIYHVLMFSGFQGLGSFLVVLPVGCLLWNLFGWETFQFPPSEAFATLILNGFAFVIFIPCLQFGLQWTNPSFVGVGCAMTIPLSIVTDYAFHGIIPSYVDIIGSLVTLVGVAGYSMMIREDAK